jgi:chlorobactene glucosyltransferase
MIASIPRDLVLALPWIAAPLLLPLLIRRRPWLHDARIPAGPVPLVSVIVPARNEADNISGITATLLSSRYPRFEVILVDDRSTDGTTEIAHRLAGNHAELVRVLDGEPLPRGWMGKCWACWQGYKAAGGDVLVFTDADTRHHQRLLGHTVGALQDTGADLLTLFPRQLMFTVWERIIQPHVFTAITLRYRDGNRINGARNPRDVIANGQFIAFTREGYEAIGGHEAVRADIVEDLRLAQRTVAAGRRMYIAWGDDLIATRMYRTFRQIVEGWSKNLAHGSRQSVDPWLRPLLPWAVALFLIGYWVTPPLALASHFFTSAVPLTWAAASTMASIAFWVWMYRTFGIPVLYALLYPVGAAVTAVLFIRSTILGQRIRWKGRTYEDGVNTQEADQNGAVAGIGSE